MKTTLITGAYGFLGRHTASLFKKHGFRVIGMGHGHWGFEHPGDFGIDQWFEADIDFSSLVKIEENLDCIIHCAGGSSVGYSMQYPLRDFHRTVTASVNLLEYIRLQQPGARLIYPSSAAVYGAKDDKPLKENEALSPVSPYGFHKKIVEELCSSYVANFGLSVAIIRFFSVYGAGLEKQLLWDACNKLSQAKEKKQVIFFGTGDETRDWIHVEDSAELIYHMSQAKENFEIINGASGKKKDIKQILSQLASFFNNSTCIDFNRQFKEGDPKYYWADISLAKQKGWQPKMDMDNGISDYVDWFKTQK
jgi:UDP-glucose 4-epimerase